MIIIISFVTSSVIRLHVLDYMYTAYTKFKFTNGHAHVHVLGSFEANTLFMGLLNSVGIQVSRT